MKITGAALADFTSTRLHALRRIHDRAMAPGKLDFRNQERTSLGDSFSIIERRQAAETPRSLLYVGNDGKTPMAAFMREADARLDILGRRNALSGTRFEDEMRMRMVVTAGSPEDLGIVVACGKKKVLFLTGTSSHKPNNWQTADILWTAGAEDSVFNQQGAVVGFDPAYAAAIINRQVPFQVRVRVPGHDLAEAIVRDHTETLVALGIRRFKGIKGPGQAFFLWVGNTDVPQTKPAQLTGVVLEVVEG